MTRHDNERKSKFSLSIPIQQCCNTDTHTFNIHCPDMSLRLFEKYQIIVQNYKKKIEVQCQSRACIDLAEYS